MDNGSRVALFIPFPFVLLVIGMIGAIILIGMVFAFNQIVGLIISGTLNHIRGREATAVEAPSDTDLAIGVSQRVRSE